jgi:nucleoside-diphosphate kinase
MGGYIDFTKVPSFPSIVKDNNPCRRKSVERTFLAIKPDGVQRKLVGEILGRFEAKGFTLVGLKLMTVSRELAEQHYGEHKDKPFFGGLVDFITSGPVVAMVWEGKGVVASARKMIGVTNPLNSEPGTIRGDFGVDIGRNIIHGSDAPETAVREIGLWFTPAELSTWTPTISTWIYE